MDRYFFVRRLILVALVIVWCIVIFSFSSQNSEESSETSGGLIAAVCEFIVPEFDDFNGTERQEFIDELQFAVRKTAHFTAYGILGFLSWFALFGMRNLRRYLSAVGFSFLYACSDEIHQLFVSGRSGELRDVFIDTGGAMMGALAAFGITMLIIRFRKEKKTAA